MSDLISQNLNMIFKTPKGETVHALKDLNFKIKKGELLTVLGPSGCGKSTLLRMVAGLEDITEGDINLDGKLMNEVDPSERDVAMVFQNYALFPHMTVAENLAFPLQVRKMKKSEMKKFEMNFGCLNWMQFGDSCMQHLEKQFRAWLRN